MVAGVPRMNRRVPYTEIELGGLLLQEPVGLLTNLLIVAVCVWAVLRLRQTASRLAVAFFACMALAHLSGGIAHTFFYVLGEPMHLVGWTFSAAGLALLEVATLRRTWPRVSWWVGLALVQFVAFLVAAILVRHFVVTAVNAAVGLLLVVLPALIVSWRRDDSATARWHLGAIGVMVLPALVNAWAWSPHRWLNANDIGHLLIAVAIWLFYRGFSTEPSS